MVTIMKQCSWEPIFEFDGWNEYERFQFWLNKQIENCIAEYVPVEKPYKGMSGLEECWIMHASGQVWRLIKPDPPFAGLFNPVD
jgi:hypothetical protein